MVDIGLPLDPAEDNKEYSQYLASILDAADKQVLTQIPMLAKPPPHFKRPSTKTGTRLYNGIASLNDDSIAFVGLIPFSNFFRNAEAQAIWTTAYIDENKKLPDTEQAEKETVHMNAFSKRRYPSLAS